jgi:hypothetical protein
LFVKYKLEIKLEELNYKIIKFLLSCFLNIQSLIALAEKEADLGEGLWGLILILCFKIIICTNAKMCH